MRHIFESIPPTNRWFPVFERYIAHVADRTRSFGTDPDKVEPSPDGTGVRDKPSPLGCPQHWIASGLLAAILVTWGIFQVQVAAVLTSIAIVTWVATYCWYEYKCKPSWCSRLNTLLIGVGVAAAILGFLYLAGVTTSNLLSALAVSAISTGTMAIASWLLYCGKGCCSD
ncbi:hypothetical protein [Calothrix rhizosoleniae]|uniref:hypothetical protein n=1 Tax=Calothrix rhizosoleniae TaxID=888997 RepID=UPI001177B2DC|nr:hypothetical protein [Calothrix rhizosoleniae]